MLQRWGSKEHMYSCWVLKEYFYCSLSSMMFAVGFFVAVLCQVMKFLSLVWVSLYPKRVNFNQCFFCIFLDDMGFLGFVLMQKQACLSRRNPLFNMQYFLYIHWIQLASIFWCFFFSNYNWHSISACLIIFESLLPHCHISLINVSFSHSPFLSL